MKERKRNLRRLGVGGSIAAFLAAWAIVFGQLVGGHDPALAGQKTSQAQEQSTTSSGQTSSDDTSSDDTSSDDTSSDDTSTDTGSSAAPAPVTTSQS